MDKRKMRIISVVLYIIFVLVFLVNVVFDR